MMAIVFGAFVYMIVALQVYTGSPPFYKESSFFRTPEKEEVMKVLPVFALMAIGFFPTLIIASLVEVKQLMILSAIFPIYAGIKIRQFTKSGLGLPRPWITNYWTLKWPMLIFDIWTLGMSAISVFFVLLT